MLTKLSYSVTFPTTGRTLAGEETTFGSDRRRPFLALDACASWQRAAPVRSGCPNGNPAGRQGRAGLRADSGTTNTERHKRS